jgi:oligosaccharyltransferase complex subunit alpha (ribophorin I)
VLSAKLAAGEVATVEAFTIYADVQTPNPAEIAQGDPHLMEYRDFVYVLSPYAVSAQTTEVGSIQNALMLCFFVLQQRTIQSMQC